MMERNEIIEETICGLVKELGAANQTEAARIHSRIRELESLKIDTK